MGLESQAEKADGEVAEQLTGNEEFAAVEHSRCSTTK